MSAALQPTVTEKIRDYYLDNPDACKDKKLAFIAALRDKGIVRRAMEIAHIDRCTPYIWRQIDPEFRQAWDMALEDATDNVEESLHDMAVSRKNVVATIVWLKAHRSKYRDRVAIDINAMHGEIEERLGPLQLHRVSNLSNPAISPSEPQSVKDIIADVIGRDRPTASQQRLTATTNDDNDNRN